MKNKLGGVVFPGLRSYGLPALSIGENDSDEEMNEKVMKHVSMCKMVAQSEARYRAIFDNTIDAMLITNNKMKILDVNNAACILFGIDRDNLMKKELTDLIAESSMRNIKSRWKNFQTKGWQIGELEIKNVKGEVRIVEYSGKAGIFPDRNLLDLRDVTDRVLEEKRRQKFLDIAGHELRSPLASINIFLQILKKYLDGLNDERVHQYIAKIDNKSDDLIQLVNDWLDFTRVKEGKLEFTNELFDFDTFLNQIIDDLQVVIKTHKIVLKSNTKSQIVADKKRITQVINNLVRNAAKYSPNARKIDIETKLVNANIELAVRDYGIGISDENKKMLFSMYYREQPGNKQAAKGLGVGLFISAEIIRQYGGKIWVESDEGKGSTFRISLPLQPKIPLKSKWFLK